MKSPVFRFMLLSGLLFLFFSTDFLQGQDRRKKAIQREYEKHSKRAAPRDKFPVFHNPKKVSVKKADKFMNPNEWVIGVTINGESAAYPIQIMGVHELGNDTVGGKPITVCW